MTKLILIPFLLLAYSFVSGMVGAWIHHYLVGTSKAGEYYHDHRMCVFVSIFWFVPLVVLVFVYYTTLVKYVYKYPGALFNEVKNRKKKLQTEKT